MLPEPIKNLVDQLAQLPSIGPRQAIRLAFHIKNRGDSAVEQLASSIAGLAKLKTCPSCFLVHESGNSAGLCHICDNPQRDPKLVAVVEKETDLISLERTQRYGGRYLILGELKKDGSLSIEQKARLASIKDAEEIILGISPTTFGDLNVAFINQELKNSAKKITRLGRGLPTGGEIEFADDETLGSALENRN
ncbi:MAG: recombination protein RecR [Parcubacteria group bacterium Gr01-1014_3]|nr:MAG: recombination protein RecR [Parcubacteria group bacterium Gr01-1014_3]